MKAGIAEKRINENTHKERSIRFPLGTTLLIPPQPSDYNRPGGKRHYIACLFTSFSIGDQLDSEEDILEHTALAIRNLGNQLAELREAGGKLLPIYSCRFNSGLFKVEWEEIQGRPGEGMGWKY